MPQEKEIKIELKIPLNRFLKRLKSKGFAKTGQIEQKDTYFDTPNWFLYNNLAALRLREVNSTFHSFSFKKIFCTPKRNNKYYIEEIETNFPDVNSDVVANIFSKIDLKTVVKGKMQTAQLIGILKNNNYHDEQKMVKQRKIFRNKNSVFTIDKVEQVGTIIELECKYTEPLQIIQTILSEDEWKRSIEGTSYKWLKIVKGFTAHNKNIKRFEKEPDWNVWDHEKQFYKRINTT